MSNSENIIGRISDAENRAVEIRQNAIEESRKIIASAKEEAEKIRETSEDKAMQSRRRILSSYEAKADGIIAEAVKSARAEAEKYKAGKAEDVEKCADALLAGLI